MPCNEFNPCHEPVCQNCNPINPCYQNCGCKYPSTFDCVENMKKTYPIVGLNIGDDLYDLMEKLEVKFLNLQNRISVLEQTLAVNNITLPA